MANFIFSLSLFFHPFVYVWIHTYTSYSTASYITAYTNKHNYRSTCGFKNYQSHCHWYCDSLLFIISLYIVYFIIFSFQTFSSTLFIHFNVVIFSRTFRFIIIVSCFFFLPAVHLLYRSILLVFCAYSARKKIEKEKPFTTTTKISIELN